MLSHSDWCCSSLNDMYPVVAESTTEDYEGTVAGSSESQGRDSASDVSSKRKTSINDLPTSNDDASLAAALAAVSTSTPMLAAIPDNCFRHTQPPMEMLVNAPHNVARMNLPMTNTQASSCIFSTNNPVFNDQAAPDHDHQDVLTRRLSLPKLQTSHQSPSFARTTLTPSRFAGIQLFSPGHAMLATGSHVGNHWLDEPAESSLLYELGACTGWSGFLQMKGDFGGPTTGDTITSAWPNSTAESSAALVTSSAVDWWAHDTVAQHRFHEYMLATLPRHVLLRKEELRSSLAASVISKFLTYCALLWGRETHAPQPPFLHRALMLKHRSYLPSSLAIARSSLASLASRLPSNEGWAWGRTGSDVAELLEKGKAFVKQRASLRSAMGASAVSSLIIENMTLEGLWEEMGMVQALWCYMVVGSFGDWLEFYGNNSGQWNTDHRFWGPMLLPLAVEVSQAVVQELAITALALQQHDWQAPRLASSDASCMTEFVWWGMCETLRRSVLAMHTLLILMRFCRYAHDPYAIPATLGSQPCLIGEYKEGWNALMLLKLPAVATLFEAPSSLQWRTRMDRWQHDSPSLQDLLDKRPENKAQLQYGHHDFQFYFNEHDEFTNVCLSALFGLASTRERPT